MIEIQTTEEFLVILEAKQKVVADFYTTWCGPCRTMAPIFSNIALLANDLATFCKINIEKFPVFAEKFGISHVPTFIYFSETVEKNRWIGFLNKEEILTALE